MPTRTAPRALALALPAGALARPRDFLVVLLRDLPLRLLEKPVVVVADGADRETARAVPERADHAQEPLPDAEPLVAPERRQLCVSALGADEAAEYAQDRREAELLREGRAAALVEPPVLNGVGRAGVEAA